MIHVLCCDANPETEEELAIDEEMRGIVGAIAPGARRHFKIDQARAMRITDLPRNLLNKPPDIFHFSGHGSKKGELIFEDERGEGQKVKKENIRLIFEALGKGIKCVVLSSCYSAPQAKEIIKYVPYVIGSRNAIDDTLAIKFSITFYECLSHGKSITDAYKVAKAVVTSSGRNKDQLFMLTNKSLAELQTDVLYHPPVIRAMFMENKKTNKPRKTDTMYHMKFWVEHCPSEVLSVDYYLSYDKKEYGDEIVNDGLGIDYEDTFYGNLKMRVTLWYQDEGIGYVTTIYDSLVSYYSGQRLTTAIKKALTDIREN